MPGLPGALVVCSNCEQADRNGGDTERLRQSAQPAGPGGIRPAVLGRPPAVRPATGLDVVGELADGESWLISRPIPKREICFASKAAAIAAN